MRGEIEVNARDTDVELQVVVELEPVGANGNPGRASAGRKADEVKGAPDGGYDVMRRGGVCDGPGIVQEILHRCPVHDVRSELADRVGVAAAQAVKQPGSQRAGGGAEEVDDPGRNGNSL